MKNDEDLRKAQLIMLEMLEFLDKFCKSNKIEYWLDSGTLLGAIRHKGFIPWDDDIDICMTTLNYKKFIKKYEELTENKYFLLKPFTKYYKIDILKLKNKNNFLIEFEKQKYHKGIHLDIFEFKEYKIKDNKLDKLLSQLYLIKSIGLLSINNSNHNKLYIILRYLLLKILPINTFIKILEFLEQKKGGEYLGYSLKSGACSRILKKDIFPLQKIFFEKNYFYAPNNVKNYMKELYGENYMILPPKEKRTFHAWKIILNEKGEKL